MMMSRLIGLFRLNKAAYQGAQEKVGEYIRRLYPTSPQSLHVLVLYLYFLSWVMHDPRGQ